MNSTTISLIHKFSSTAVAPPNCEPICSENAHCVYGQINTCKCDKGYTGNPYVKCLPRRKITCATATCGSNAVCQQTKSHVECLCPPGYVGNPNLQCIDIDECISRPCAENAICINTPGSYSCICKSKYIGNPYELCTQVSISKCVDGSVCSCSRNATCPDGFMCENSKCVDVCHSKICGPNSICEEGRCVCLPSYTGNPNDLIQGCSLDSKCVTDTDCKNSEICFQLGKTIRKCVDACTKIQCGPNSLCASTNHQAHCVCAEGYIGKPSDVKTGCHLEQRGQNQECATDSDCVAPQICFSTDGISNKCIDLCSTITCSQNEICNIVDNVAHCDCKIGFIWNPISSMCEQPSTPNCDNDDDCDDNRSCQKDVLGVKKCVDNCAVFTCPQNSRCITKNHKSQCQCLAGFVGNPNDRDGCSLLDKNECSNDVECKENDVCKDIGSSKKCVPACQQIVCGPNAICVTNNHVAKCQCPSGPFTGDPDDLKQGCQSVPCVYNIDCPSHELCNRFTHKCINVCTEDSCGENAVCIAEDHKYKCQCLSGYAPDPLPEISCRKTELCNPNPCHETAICEPQLSTYICKCPSGYNGDPINDGCTKQGDCPRGDIDCLAESVCVNGSCINPCEGACGVNTLCNVVNKKALCSCPDGYEGASDGKSCKKKVMVCANEYDCDGDICHNGQCFSACKNSSHCNPGEECVKNYCVTKCRQHAQCSIGQACVEGQCLIGCRTNENCPIEEACVNNKCVNPCLSTRVCGPNAICSRINHSTKCECPEGFEGSPTPQQGCVRKPASCTRTSQCPPDHMCIGLLCQVPCQDNSNCAMGETCNDNKCLKICHSSSNCLHGEHCSAGVCIPGCKSNSDCTNNQLCVSNECECAPGFKRNNGECTNLDECLNNPCHPSAQCIDTEGSFKCICPTDAIGDPYKNGCLLPNQCRRDSQCDNSLACMRGKCSNPCQSNACGRNAVCQVNQHRVTCTCEKGHLGNPFDKNLGCFKVECISDLDCPNDKYCNPQSNKCSGKHSVIMYFSLHLLKISIKDN